MSSFDVQHALDCKLGGLRTIQHNEVRDVLAQCMREAGHAPVEVEPKLQELSGEVFDYKSANASAKWSMAILTHSFSPALEAWLLSATWS